MGAYILTWKPKNSDIENRYTKIYQNYLDGVAELWARGTRKNYREGELVFLLRQKPDRSLGKKGDGYPGLIGYGYDQSSEPVLAQHWDPDEDGQLDYVTVKFEYLQKPQEAYADIPLKELENIDPIFKGRRGSGAELDDDLTAHVLGLIKAKKGFEEFIGADEITDTTHLTEGAVKTITVNAYERNPKARQKCIEHWGSNCSVCGFNFKSYYRELGEGFIHVHHLKPIAKVGEEYKVDPVNDLRPVCPNCHSMLHRKKELLSIEELKNLIEGNGHSSAI